MGGCSIILPYNFNTHAPPKLVKKELPEEEEEEANEETDLTSYDEIFDPEQKAAVDIEFNAD